MLKCSCGRNETLERIILTLCHFCCNCRSDERRLQQQPAPSASAAAAASTSRREEEERREAIRAAHAESKRRVKLRKLLKRQGATDSEIREAVAKGATTAAAYAAVDRGASAALAHAHAASVLRSAPASEPRGVRTMSTKPTTGNRVGSRCALSLPWSRLFECRHVCVFVWLCVGHFHSHRKFRKQIESETRRS